MVAYAFGILAMQMTTIADAVLLFATAPFFAAALGWFALSERVALSTWWVIIIALVGTVIMQRGAIAMGERNRQFVRSRLGLVLCVVHAGFENAQRR